MKHRKLVLFLVAFGSVCLLLASGERPFPVVPEQGADAPRSPADAIADIRDPLPNGALARLGTIRQRVSQSAKLAIRPDGRTFVTVVADCTIGEWDVVSGTMLRQWRLPGAPIEKSWLAPNGQLLAVNEKEKLVIWDLAEGTQRHVLPANPWHVAFSADGKRLATTLEKKSWIDLWNLADGKKCRLAIDSDHADSFIFSPDLTFSPDGKRLFAAVDNGTLYCWDVLSGYPLWRNDGRMSWPLVVSPDGRMLCTAGGLGEGKLQLWKAEGGRQINKIAFKKETLAYASPVAFTSGGRSVLLNAREGMMTWDLDNGKISRRMPQVDRFALTPDGKTSITLTGSLVQRWDMESFRPLYPDTQSLGHASAVVALAFSPDARTLASSSANNTIRLWDLATGQPRTFPARTSKGIWRYLENVPGSCTLRKRYGPPTLAFTPDSRKLLAESEEGKLSLRRVDSGEETQRMNVCQDCLEVISTARISPDGRTIWTYHSESPFIFSEHTKHADILFTWDVRSGRRLSSRPITPDVYTEPRDVHLISPDGRYAAYDDGPIVDVATCQPRLSDASNSVKFHSFAFSPDSRLIAGARPPDSRRLEEEVRVYEMFTGRLLFRASAAVNHMSSCAFSPDGRLLVAAGADALHVWEVATGRRLLHLPAEGRWPYWCPGHFATCVAVAPNGRCVATGHDDGTILLWDLAPAWQRLTEQRKKLTPARRLACWNDMLAVDPKTAYHAMTELIADPAATVSFLGEHIRPLPINTQAVDRWLRDLDSADFAKRERASRELTALADRIEPRLQQALKETKSLEVRRRLRDILDTAKKGALSPETVRQLRCVAVLEQIATSEARQVLNELGRDESTARMTAAAQDALRRLRPKK